MKRESEKEMTDNKTAENDVEAMAMLMRHANGDHFEPIQSSEGRLGFAATERGAMVLMALQASSEKLGVEFLPTPGMFFVANYAARFSQELVGLAMDKILAWSEASMGTIPFNVHLAGEAFSVSVLVASVEAVWSSVLGGEPGEELMRSLAVCCAAGDAFGAVRMNGVIASHEGTKEKPKVSKAPRMSDAQMRAILRRPRGLA